MSHCLALLLQQHMRVKLAIMCHDTFAFIALQAKQKPMSATQKAAGMLPEATAPRTKTAYNVSLMLEHV